MYKCKKKYQIISRVKTKLFFFKKVYKHETCLMEIEKNIFSLNINFAESLRNHSNK